VYVRYKVIKGHTYYYLVRGERHGTQVKQKVVRYLGKHPWRYVTPIRFARVVRKDYTKLQTQSLYRRRMKSIACRHGKETAKTPSVFAMAHEFGHLLDTTIKANVKTDLPAFRGELERVNDHLAATKHQAYISKRQPYAERFANLFALCTTQPRQA
jgi:hypothetical protein